MDVSEYKLPDDLDKSSYCVFPPELENDDLVFFHGTLAANLPSIVEDGFQIPAKNGGVGLSSVSFSKKSSMALTHVCTKRQSEPGDYLIIAVRYESIDRESVVVNVSDIHDYTLDPSPSVIGYCIVPTSYPHG